MAKKRRRKRRINPIRLLIVIAIEMCIIVGLLIVCIKIFPDSPILQPIKDLIVQEPPVVVLDAGHGGYDSGTVYQDVYEKDVTLAIVKDIGNYLEEHGYPVAYTRESDEVSWPSIEQEDLQERVNISNNSGARYFVSIHTNATDYDMGSNGYEIWGKMQDEKVATLSENILTEIDTLGYSLNRGAKDQDTYPLYVLENNDLPAILIEAGFLASEQDRNYLLDEEKRKLFAHEIADGIIKTLEAEEEENTVQNS